MALFLARHWTEDSYDDFAFNIFISLKPNNSKCMQVHILLYYIILMNLQSYSHLFPIVFLIQISQFQISNYIKVFWHIFLTNPSEQLTQKNVIYLLQSSKKWNEMKISFMQQTAIHEAFQCAGPCATAQLEPPSSRPWLLENINTLCYYPLLLVYSYYVYVIDLPFFQCLSFRKNSFIVP